VTPERGLIDTSVVIALDAVPVEGLPEDLVVSALTLAELATGPASASDSAERTRRMDLIQRTEATFETIPFDSDCSRAYGHVHSAVIAIGRKPRGGRMVDLLIAATALAHQLPLYTLNAADLRGLDDLIEIVDLG
jgi:predicted nucleic acid-binding protein